MANDLIQFVDAISASPTVRLDINDGIKWFCSTFSAPPPRLRRSVSSNAMRDGINVSSSQYDSRVLVLSLELITSTQDLNAAEWQKLARELDRPNNLLKYQPNTLTKPVFFRLYRSDMSQLADVMAQQAMREITVELLAEPFALGLRELISLGNISNDPAAAAGCFFDVTGVIGDVTTPMLMQQTSPMHGSIFMASRQHGTPSDLKFVKQAESCTFYTDTTNPGGGPDVNMSGPSANNFARTTFATVPTMVDRLSWDIITDHNTAAKQAALAGTYRVLVTMRRSDATSVFSVRIASNAIPAGWGTAAAPSLTTSRQTLDLGVISFDKYGRTAGYGPVMGAEGSTVQIQASRTSGAGTVDWDCIFLIPIDEMTHIETNVIAGVLGYLTDSVRETVINYTGDPFASTGTVRDGAVFVSGGWPVLVPNQTNRFFLLLGEVSTGPFYQSSVARIVQINVSYFPRYLFVRPATT